MKPRLRFTVGFLFLIGLVTVPFAAASAPQSEAVDIKIRLLSEALHARDHGNWEAARTALRQLLEISPQDETITRLLASIDRRSSSGSVEVKEGAQGTVEAATSEMNQLIAAEELRIAKANEAANAAIKEARALLRQRYLNEAWEVTGRALTGLPESPLTRTAAAELSALQNEINVARRARRVDESSDQGAHASLIKTEANPKVSAGPDVALLVSRGRSQYLAGDARAAEATFERALEFDATNQDAQSFLDRIEREKSKGDAERVRTSAQMVGEVQTAWRRPVVSVEAPRETVRVVTPSPLLEKLNAIVLPNVNFSGMELTRAVNTLSALSEECDHTGDALRGVNIVLIDPSNENPSISLTLRHAPLKRVLDHLTRSVGYHYEVEADAVIVRPGVEQVSLETQFFPVSRSTVLRMTGKGGAANASVVDPLTGATVSSANVDIVGEGHAIKNFLQLAGVDFDTPKGSTLAFDGSQLIATQSPRNLERIRTILNRYNDVRQVEIEAKFMEVQQGALEELGVQWNIATKASQQNAGVQALYSTGGGVNRALQNAFRSSGTGSQGSIIRPAIAAVIGGDGEVTSPGQDPLNLPIINTPPLIPGTNNIGLGVGALANITGVIGEFDVNAVIRALSQKSGTELLSAPKLTVLSGNQATITVAQELRYPQSYGQVQSQVGTGSASGGGSAGVAITAGTPQEFGVRNVGVELKVTPTVEEDDYSVSLDLNPKVTEFEGFVEYGGQSIAISGNTTVTVPSGFYQPIFSVREVTTKVTIWDGATLVMGGLTREDVKKVNDKVPILGSLPGIGRLFRSQGESTQKRNLLIFVTANLVNPGGSLKHQGGSGQTASTVYQNPRIVTPREDSSER
jgi:general secretion pathway protein D